MNRRGIGQMDKPDFTAQRTGKYKQGRSKGSNGNRNDVLHSDASFLPPRHRSPILLLAVFNSFPDQLSWTLALQTYSKTSLQVYFALF